jgi:fumarylpyruvate hydrolase
LEALNLNFIIPQPPIPAVKIAGSEIFFPVHRVYCVGRNYADHAREMGHNPDREEPFFFQKSPDNLLPAGVPKGGVFPYPSKSVNVQYEVEMVCALGAGGKEVSKEEAINLIWGYSVGLDMTRRDLQGEAKKAGRPWDIAKAFEYSAPISPLRPVADTKDISQACIWLNVNGERRQEGNINQLIWSIPETISYLSELFELRPGDLIFTGTPSGVGKVYKGDLIEGGVDGLEEIKINVI